MTEPVKDFKDVELKLIILYIINTIVLPMSREQITDMVVGGEFMDYYTLQQNLTEMQEQGLLDTESENTMDKSTTRFTATEEGLITLEMFERRIPFSTRQTINRYAKENRRKIKKDYEKTATYFPNEDNDEFRVKCGMYEDDRALIELFITVDTREQAKIIQYNWRNSPYVFEQIMNALTKTPEPPEEPQENKVE
jgi:DNA-binding PadR family transcriptional regulator